MDLLERTAAHLNSRITAREQKKPSHINMISENSYLLEAANKLRKQSLVNQNNYNNLLCMKQLNRKKSSVTNYVQPDKDSPVSPL